MDDEPDTVAFLCMLLEDSGFCTVSASDPNRVADVIREHKPDLVTLDIMMPGKSGFKIYSELKNNSVLRDLPVIIVSGAGLQSFESSAKCPDGGPIPTPDAYVEKPVDGGILISTIRKIIPG